MPWVVVEFLPHRGFDEITVQTVPLCWIMREAHSNFIMYPPIECPPAMVQKMIRKEQQPVESWDMLQCGYVTSPFDDILGATQLEIKVADCEDTDLETYVATLSSGGEKRKRVAKDIRYPNEPLSDSEFMDSEDMISNPPSPPDNVLSGANVITASRRVVPTKLPKPLQRPGEARISVASADMRSNPSSAPDNMLSRANVTASRRVAPTKLSKPLQRLGEARISVASADMRSNPSSAPDNMLSRSNVTASRRVAPTKLSKPLQRPGGARISVAGADMRSNPSSAQENVLSRENVATACRRVVAPQLPKPLERPGEAPASYNGHKRTEKPNSSSSCAASAAVDITKPSLSKQPSVRPFSASGTSQERAREASEVVFEELFGDSITILDTVATGSTNCPTTELKAFISEAFDDFKQEMKNALRRELRAQIAQSTEEVKEAIRAINFKMDSIKLHTKGDDEEGELMHRLPMETIQEVTDFEEEICSNSKYRKFMVQYLRERSSNMLFRNLTEKFFQTALNKTVNDVLSLLFINQLGMEFCMKGRNPKKISFESCFPSIMNLVFEVLKTKGNSGPQMEQVTVGRSMGEWFRLARMRAGNKINVNDAEDVHK